VVSNSDVAGVTGEAGGDGEGFGWVWVFACLRIWICTTAIQRHRVIRWDEAGVRNGRAMLVWIGSDVSLPHGRFVR